MDISIGAPELLTFDAKRVERVESILKNLILTNNQIEKIRTVFKDEIEKSLRGESSSLQMANTYISELPDGSEEGKYIAVDLGGTNFRVLFIEFRNGEIVEEHVQYYSICEDIRLGSGEVLFDYVADSIIDFLKANQLSRYKVSLGFTFSFPMIQQSLNCGILNNWTKSFNCADVIGRDVVQLLNDALTRKGCNNVSVNAILNDTTGTLMTGALIDKKTTIGLIVGTGCNACYMEKAERLKHRKAESHGENEMVVIDVEWGAFGDNGVLNFIKTDFDVQVDENSLLVNSFTFEKYISGKYLGEIVRVVLVKLVGEGLLFGGNLSTALKTPHSFSTAFLSNIEEDAVNNNVENTLKILERLGISSCTEDDVTLLRYVCGLVSNRSALLVATCLAVLMERIDNKEMTIAVDGSVFGKHPSYRFLLNNYVKRLTDKKFNFLRVSDGSGKGAAIVVAIDDKLKERYKVS